MKEIWQKLRLRKADEMEQFILFKAQRNAYFFLLFPHFHFELTPLGLMPQFPVPGIPGRSKIRIPEGLA